VQVERLHRDVVQALDGETGLFTDLADGGVLWTLSRVDPPVHRLPGTRAAYPRCTLEHERVPLSAPASQHEDVDDADADRRDVAQST
jgi:hypothetical protein